MMFCESATARPTTSQSQIMTERFCSVYPVRLESMASLVANNPSCFIQLASSLRPTCPKCGQANIYQVGFPSPNNLIPSSSNPHLILSVRPSQLTSTNQKKKREHVDTKEPSRMASEGRYSSGGRRCSITQSRRWGNRCEERRRRHQPARLSHAGRGRLRPAVAYHPWLRRRRRGVRGRFQRGSLQEGRSCHWVRGAV